MMLIDKGTEHRREFVKPEQTEEYVRLSPEQMAELKLIKKIADIVIQSRPSCGLKKECYTECGTCGSLRILQAVKDAGYKSPEEWKNHLRISAEAARDTVAQAVKQERAATLKEVKCKLWGIYRGATDLGVLEKQVLEFIQTIKEGRL